MDIEDESAAPIRILRSRLPYFLQPAAGPLGSVLSPLAPSSARAHDKTCTADLPWRVSVQIASRSFEVLGPNFEPDRSGSTRQSTHVPRAMQDADHAR